MISRPRRPRRKPRRRLLLLTAAAALASTLPTSVAFVSPRTRILPYPDLSVASMTATRLYGSKSGILSRAAKKVFGRKRRRGELVHLERVEHDYNGYYHAEQEVQAGISSRGGFSALIKHAAQPGRMVKSLMNPLLSGVASKIQESAVTTLEVLDEAMNDALDFIISNDEAATALGAPIMVEAPFSQSTSSSSEHGVTSHHVQVQFYVQGNHERGVATMTATEKGIQSLSLNVAGHEMNISLMKSFFGVGHEDTSNEEFEEATYTEINGDHINSEGFRSGINKEYSGGFRSGMNKEYSGGFRSGMNKEYSGGFRSGVNKEHSGGFRSGVNKEHSGGFRSGVNKEHSGGFRSGVNKEHRKSANSSRAFEGFKKASYAEADRPHVEEEEFRGATHNEAANGHRKTANGGRDFERFKESSYTDFSETSSTNEEHRKTGEVSREFERFKQSSYTEVDPGHENHEDDFREPSFSSRVDDSELHVPKDGFRAPSHTEVQDGGYVNREIFRGASHNEVSGEHGRRSSGGYRGAPQPHPQEDHVTREIYQGASHAEVNGGHRSTVNAGRRSTEDFRRPPPPNRHGGPRVAKEMYRGASHNTELHGGHTHKEIYTGASRSGVNGAPHTEFNGHSSHGRSRNAEGFRGPSHTEFKGGHTQNTDAYGTAQVNGAHIHRDGFSGAPRTEFNGGHRNTEDFGGGSRVHADRESRHEEQYVGATHTHTHVNGDNINPGHFGGAPQTHAHTHVDEDTNYSDYTEQYGGDTHTHHHVDGDVSYTEHFEGEESFTSAYEDDHPSSLEKNGISKDDIIDAEVVERTNFYP